MRYFFHIGYNGSQYSGWQKLPQINSVQLAIETAITRIVKTPIAIVGCGRTDAQVHASQYFFHADIDERLIPELLFRLNKNLPDDIAIFEIIPVKDSQHARFNATQRRYDYFIHRYKDPFLSRCSAFYDESHLDLQKMKEATLLLTRYDDYQSFFRLASKPKTTICRVTEATLFTDQNGDRLKFTISSNRFLRGMVRIVIQKLLEVGRGKISVEQFESYLTTTGVPKDLGMAYSQGLYLSRIVYPFLDIPPRTKFDLLVNGADTWKEI